MSNVEIVPGDAGKDRFFAAIFDNVIAIILGLIAAAWIPDDQLVLRGTGLAAAYLLYFLFCESLFGSTIGKIMFNLWVRRVEGGRCTVMQAVMRTLARIVEVNPLLLGALPAGITILVTRNKQRLGDMIAGTVVRKGRAN